MPLAPLPMSLHFNEKNNETHFNSIEIEQNGPKILPKNLTLIQEGKFNIKH